MTAMPSPTSSPFSSHILRSSGKGRRFSVNNLNTWITTPFRRQPKDSNKMLCDLVIRGSDRHAPPAEAPTPPPLSKTSSKSTPSQTSWRTNETEAPLKDKMPVLEDKTSHVDDRACHLDNKASYHEDKPSKPEASLLGMPGELRNTIYRLVLLSDNMIKVSEASPSQPPLLSVNRQIRHEALPIFQTENIFKVDAWDMALAIPPNYPQHWLSRIAYKNFFITMRGGKDWGNLKGWLERYARHEVPGLAPGQPTKEAEVLAQGFELVYCLLEKMEFEEMGPVLEAWIQTVELAGVVFDFR